MFGSSAGNGAAIAEGSGRRKLLNKRRGVSPQAILCSIILCGSAFAYALSVSENDAEPLAGAELAVAAEAAQEPEMTVASVQAAEAPLPETTRPAPGRQLEDVAAKLRQPSPDARPRPQPSLVRPIESGNPRFAHDVEPVEDGFDWEGKLARNGNEIVTVSRRNPLIANRDQEPELAFAPPAPKLRQAAAEFSDDGLVSARTRAAVNMRSAAKKNAAVVTVLPSGATIRVAQDCQHWCPTVYKDMRGYVYKSYITLVDLGSTASIRRQKAEKTE
jgi:hypothetical protein